MEGSKEIFCLCGCGLTVGQPMEFVNGEWVITPLSQERLQELALAPHPKTHSSVCSGDIEPCSRG